MATKSRTRRPLTKKRVLEKAIAVADKDGIEALSMRKLGQALGVEAMSLYNHVTNKSELVAAMVDSVVDQFELPDDEPRWDAAIRRCATNAPVSTAPPAPAIASVRVEGLCDCPGTRPRRYHLTACQTAYPRSL